MRNEINRSSIAFGGKRSKIRATKLLDFVVRDGVTIKKLVSFINIKCSFTRRTRVLLMLHDKVKFLIQSQLSELLLAALYVFISF